MIENKGRFKKGYISYWTGKKLSEEHKKKIGLKSKGRHWKLSDEAIQKIRERMTGTKQSPETLAKLTLVRKGRICKPETRLKMSIASKGRKVPIDKVVRGAKHHMWKGGITPIHNKIRGSLEGRLWIKSVFGRDKYTCQKTGIKGGKLVAHHILNFSSHPESRFLLENGITLSLQSHQKFHHIYGRVNNTKEQLQEFLKNI